MKLVLLTNILSPYRKVFYDKLNTVLKENGVEFKLLVMAETEPNRKWHYEEYRSDYCELLPSRTVTVKNMYLHFNKTLIKRLKQLHPDLLIASGSYMAPSVIESILLKRRLKYRLYFWSESHDNELRNYSKPIIKLRNILRTIIYRSFDGFWYAGSKSLEFINRYAVNKQNPRPFDTCFIPNLVDPDFYRMAYVTKPEEKLMLREAYQVAPDKFVFLLPARLAPEKGILPFLTLLNNCTFKNKATVLILGEGELEHELRQFITLTSLDVRLLGYKKQETTINFYKLADAFLLPSISDPNPLSCIEALWAGLPLLVSEHVGNYPETVSFGQNGYVFDYKEPENTVKIIDSLISANEVWRTFARQLSLRIAQEVFDPDTAVENLVKCILKNYRRLD